MLAWIRRHPFRLGIYVLLLVAAGWAGIASWRDPLGLLARAVESTWLRNAAERQFGVRYAVDRVTLASGCASVVGLDIELIGAAKARLENGKACLAGNLEVGGITVGERVIQVQSVRFEPPLSVNGEALTWRDQAGELVSVKRFTASGVEGLAIPDLATVQFASYTPARVEIIGTHAIVDRAALAPVPARFQAAANSLLAMAAAVLPFPARWSATAWRLLVRALIAVTAFLLLLKALVTRTPLWALVAPFAIFPLLALMASWVVILVAAPVIAGALWALAYRHKPEWHQRWEPVPLDVLTILLALPMLLLFGWPALLHWQLPSIGRIVLPEIVVRDTTATVREPQCGAGDLAVVSIPQASATNVQVEGTRVDVERASASGEVRARQLVVPFQVDYDAGRAQFSAELPNLVAVKGSADLTAARLDELRTLPGAPVQVGKATARLTWPGDLVGNAHLQAIAAAGATIDSLSADFRAGLPCGGSNRLSASATLGGIAASATGVSVTVPQAVVTLSGALAGERLEAEAGVATERLSIPPVHFTADFPGGEFEIPKQHIALAQEITARLPRSIQFDLEASRGAAHVFLPRLIPDVAPAALELTDLKIDVDSNGPRFAIGGNKLTLPELPTGITVQRIPNFHVETRGELDRAPLLELPALKLPSFDMAQLVTRNLRVSLPGLKLESIDLETEGPIRARVHVTDTTAEAVVSQPVAARVSTTSDAVRAALTAPLDTALFGIPGTVTELQAGVEFAQNRLAGFDVAGTVEAGPLTAPATFHATHTHATFWAPSITLLPRLWVAAAGAIDFTLTPPPAYPVADRIAEAAAGLREHIRNAGRVFGDPAASLFPIRWDLDLDATNATLAPEKLSADIHSAVRTLEVAQQTIDGSLTLAAGAALSGDHLVVDLAGPADIGALGRRWRMDTPISLALRKQLRPGTNGSLYDSAWYRPFHAGPGLWRAAPVAHRAGHPAAVRHRRRGRAGRHPLAARRGGGRQLRRLLVCGRDADPVPGRSPGWRAPFRHARHAGRSAADSAASGRCLAHRRAWTSWTCRWPYAARERPPRFRASCRSPWASM